MTCEVESLSSLVASLVNLLRPILLCVSSVHNADQVSAHSGFRSRCASTLVCAFVEYYREHVVRSTVLVQRRSVATARTTDHVPSLQYRLASQPLFWTSVVSMFLAFVCTIAIVVLCLTSSRRRTCLVWSRALRGSLSAAPADADQQRLHHDDDDYGRLSSTNISRE